MDKHKFAREAGFIGAWLGGDHFAPLRRGEMITNWERGA